MRVAGAAAVAGFFEVVSKALAVVEVMARGFEDVKARLGCATALRALLAWWRPERSILCERGVERKEEGVQRGAAEIW